MIRPTVPASRHRATHRLRTQSDLDRTIKALVKQDPRLRPILAVTGMPALRKREPGFAGLARIVVGQQLSTASANAIWNRLSVAYDPFHHDAIHRATAPRLAKLGLSAAKIKTLKLLAAEIRSARLDLTALGELDAETAHKALVALHGVGPWTADVYLLFCLGHSDAWPAGDLALQDAVRAGLGLESRPTVKEMIALAEVWRPFRGAAAHLWWAYYRVARRPAIGRVTTSRPKRPDG